MPDTHAETYGRKASEPPRDRRSKAISQGGGLHQGRQGLHAGDQQPHTIGIFKKRPCNFGSPPHRLGLGSYVAKTEGDHRIYLRNTPAQVDWRLRALAMFGFKTCRTGARIALVRGASIRRPTLSCFLRGAARKPSIGTEMMVHPWSGRLTAPPGSRYRSR